MDILKQQIQNTLSLRADLTEAVKNEEQLLKLVEQYVQELIDTDFEKLLLVLYRLDVSEKKVKQALEINGAEKASNSIAKLILEREKEKAETRKNFSSGNTDWVF
ncbi:MAG: hypothetical protein R2836_06170 [Chitinophagales bacterium]